MLTKQQQIRVWEMFAEQKGIKLNPDRKIVEMLAEGVLANEKKTGFKLCPCRISDGSREMNIKLMCPCKFMEDQVWKEHGKCHCGLFIREK